MKHSFRFLANFKKKESFYEWNINEEELHHLSQVLRLSKEDFIEVFDGNGFFSTAKITDIKPKKFAKAVSQKIQKEEPKKNQLALALGALKPKTLDDLLPSLVEVGVDEIHIFLQEKTAKFRLSEKNETRWKKIILGACKQSKRNYLPKLFTWKKLSDLKDYLTKNFGKIILLSPSSEEHIIDQKELPDTVCALLGSEIGLSAEEEKLLLEIGAERVSLGTHILRSYTAAISTASILEALLNQKKGNK